MANECEELAIRNTTTAKNDSSEGEKVLKEVMDSVCPNDCAFNGNCSGGTCICAEGFTAADCSISLYQKPEIARWVWLGKWNPPLITESITLRYGAVAILHYDMGSFIGKEFRKKKKGSCRSLGKCIYWCRGSVFPKVGVLADVIFVSLSFSWRLQGRGLCDQRERPCGKVTVYGRGFISSSNLTCHIQEYKVSLIEICCMFWTWIAPNEIHLLYYVLPHHRTRLFSGNYFTSTFWLHDTWMEYSVVGSQVNFPVSMLSAIRMGKCETFHLPPRRNSDWLHWQWRNNSFF